MPEDIHSPKRGFWWSHVGWILCPRFEKTRADLIPDLTKYPELCWLNRHYLIPPILMGALVYFFVGPSALFIGYLGAVVVTGHVSFTINSFAHVYGRRRYVTSDTSRNNFFLALLTFGEGWHNNHHHYPLGTSQGHFWWEVDLSYYFLKLLETVGLVEDVRRPPRKVLTKRLIRDGHSDIGMFQTYMDKAMVSLSRAIQATGAMCEEKRHALDILLQNTMKAAEEIAQMPVASRPPAEL
jgi:stearoyl-CoA desaturase (delta-9 desaturase)